MRETEQFLALADKVGKCEAHSNSLVPDAYEYCHTYVGPLYGDGVRKVLFIGLDHGGGRGTQKALDRRMDVLDYRDQQKKWNPHYQGCVRVAAMLLDFDCIEHCSERCAGKLEEKCVLLRFAQGNAVKCAHGRASKMNFKGEGLIPYCLPLVFREIESLGPDFIVLQGRRKTGHIHRDFENLAKKWGSWETIKEDEVGFIVSTVKWNANTKRSVVLAFRHPSHGWLSRDWDRMIVPAIEQAKKPLAGQT